jgi:argininosuccinate lyase
MKLWGGRFQNATSSLMDDFNSSIQFDWQLYKHDIKGSKAHSEMLCKIGILTKSELKIIHEALEGLEADIDAGLVEFEVSNEDIHMNVEALLTERIGTLAKKIHTARSRNDQVALDLRLYIKEQSTVIEQQLMELVKALTALSEEHIDTYLPGCTHLQPAQPVRLGFHLMAYSEMFKRDTERLRDALKRVNVLPLGSGALAGTSYETDRHMIADLLDFDEVSLNAMDAVSDRDFAIEFLHVCSLVMMHMSRFSEEIIIWSSGEYRFIELDDAYSTGSSIMPQKKNPDAAELIRGKTGTVYGRLMGLLTVMKGLPLAYNKDMQEDKVPIFETVKDVTLSLDIFTKMLQTTVFNSSKMMDATKRGFLNATDAADYLVGKGMPFRTAHEVIGKMVLYCDSHHMTLNDMTIDLLKDFSELFEEDVLTRIEIENCVEAKKSYGSTSKSQVLMMIQKTNEWLNSGV